MYGSLCELRHNSNGGDDEEKLVRGDSFVYAAIMTVSLCCNKSKIITFTESAKNYFIQFRINETQLLSEQYKINISFKELNEGCFGCDSFATLKTIVLTIVAAIFLYLI